MDGHAPPVPPMDMHACPSTFLRTSCAVRPPPRPSPPPPLLLRSFAAPPPAEQVEGRGAIGHPQWGGPKSCQPLGQ